MAFGTIELLICDCDGVLVDTEHLVSKEMHRAIHRLFPDIEFSEIFDNGFGKQIEVILKEIEESFDIKFPTGFSASINKQVNNSLLSHDIAIPGVKKALDSIDIPIAVASNSHIDRLDISIRSAGLDKRVNGNSFSADLVSNPKPHPDLYLFAASRMGVEPSACLVVEDSIAGVSAARAAGMNVWGFVGASHIPSRHIETLVDLEVSGIFSDMNDLPDIVNRSIKGANNSECL